MGVYVISVVATCTRNGVMSCWLLHTVPSSPAKVGSGFPPVRERERRALLCGGQFRKFYAPGARAEPHPCPWNFTSVVDSTHSSNFPIAVA